jgi:hypothetical protein
MIPCEKVISGQHNFLDHICIHCGKEEAFCRENEFSLTLDEARALNKFLRVHYGLFKEQEEYVHILRLINGLGFFVDKHDEK